jgi:hypothetical protein
MCPACCKPAPDRVAERTRAYERECRHRLNVAIHAHLSAAEQYPPDHPAVLRTRREMADAFGFDPDIEPASTGVREDEARADLPRDELLAYIDHLEAEAERNKEWIEVGRRIARAAKDERG